MKAESGVSWQVARGHSLQYAWPPSEIGAHRVPAHARPLEQGDEADESPGQVGQLLETQCPQWYLVTELL